jgi:hypothetical protein
MPVQKNATPGTPPVETADAPSQNEETNSRDTREVTRDTAPTGTSKQDLPEVKEDPNATPQSYVHLADGTVLRVDDEDIPDGGGNLGAPHGFWQRGNKVYQVIGVFPAESVVEEK